MSENRWNPPPPPQTGLWGQWATHMIAQHQTRIHAAEQEQLEQGREMERRRLLMEARMSSGILRLLKRHLPQLVLGLLLLILVRLITGVWVDPASMLRLLRGG